MEGASSRTFIGHTDYVTAIAFSPVGSRLASGSSDRTVRIWDLTTETLPQTLDGHTQRVTTVTFSLDGLQLASSSADRTIRVWDSMTGAPRRLLEGHSVSDLASLWNPWHSANASSLLLHSLPTVSANDGWVAMDGRRVLHPPQNYISNRGAVHDNIIAFACDSGQVLILKFE